MARILPLGASVGNTIRAPGILPALHNVVEELTMNSLDSGPASISIQIDMSTFSVCVNDSGHGIHEGDLAANGPLGQWNFSSKQSTGDTYYGFRGEALAAINNLSDLTVISKTLGEKTVARTFGTTSSTTFMIGESDPLRDVLSGTIVTASNIFGRFPVRQRVIKGSVEIARIREFVQKMAVLHHSVNWTLEVVGNQHPLIQLQSDFSVASRFAKIVGQELLKAMVPVDVSCNGMRFVGLMSPPILECCHLRRDCQFFFLGRRWMRGQDFVTNNLNSEFKALLEKVNGRINLCGPQPKHAISSGVHACYVLQLICTDPTAEYDLYTEPSKTVAIFREPKRVQDIIRKLSKDLLRHCPDVDESILSDLDLNIDNDVGIVSHGPIDAATKTYNVRDRPILDEDHPSCDSLFRSAFLPSPTSATKVPEVSCKTATELATRRNSRMVSMDIENEESDSEHDTLSSQIAQPPAFNDTKIYYAPDTSKQSEQSVYNDDDMQSQTLLQPFSYAKKEFANTFLSSPDVSARTLTAKTNRLVCKEKVSQFPSAQFNSVMPSTLSRGVLTALNISKASLQNNCSVIGQADKKYLVLRIGKLLVAADQHAVDERVRLEQFMTVLSSQIKVGVLEVPPVFLAMDTAARSIICERKSLLNSCGFIYNSSKDTTEVVLTAVPLINGEALRESDFVEFVHLLCKDDVPDSLCKPPAVARILASHACRQSIKFGDSLTLEQCQCLIRKLSAVELPFICAHGRVSMVPLMNLNTLATSSEAYSTNSNRGAFRSKLSKRQKPNYGTLFN